MSKSERKKPYTTNKIVRAYKISGSYIPENVRKTLEEIENGDHIATKRPQ
ncbi:hypothetical protein [Oceanobacillus salinisoli]|nr:hypothetical protein [Oceanobacillus salinisoli]